ncbi:hypothetical protein [Pelagibius marinus]|uniref:hypothetical protein n=1 Tax=Pelagibius marinus TaxID=2762760 RepID=UPI001872DB19|nr:hypothetical protein [Pelagibius marinus]
MDFFSDAPSGYQSELVDFLKVSHHDEKVETRRTPSEEYLNDVIDFATAMQIVEIVSDRNARIRKLAPTQLGRSVMGATQSGDPGFYKFFVTNIVLMADADALISVLILDQKCESASDLHAAYQDFHFSIRCRRLEWLYEAFPEQQLLKRITDQLPWLKREKSINAQYEIAPITLNTARHHTTPRKDWLVWLGLVDEPEKSLTELGGDILQTLAADGEYFWLGPPSGLQEALRIPENARRAGPYEDNITFRANSRVPNESEVQDLIEKTAQIMMQGYEAGKLVYAPQASLHLPIAYIQYRSYMDGANYAWQDILEHLFRQKRPMLERLSARKGPIGFYKAKSREAT